MDTLDDFLFQRPIPAERPLTGVTILLVEDSRYAADAVRLFSQRSGARVRRADSLQSARRHLQVYRPSVAIVDMGLPDGTGEELISELSRSTQRVPVILGTSAGPEQEAAAIRAGADGFLAKPMASLAAFQEVILTHLPEQRPPAVPHSIGLAAPDPLAYRDDLDAASRQLRGGQEGARLGYLRQFITSVAHSAGDEELELAAEGLGQVPSDGEWQRRVDQLLKARLAREVPFAGGRAGAGAARVR